MADPVDPVTPPASSETASGLPSNVAATLACFPLLGGIIFYLLEKRDPFVRFYAMQSIIFGLAWVVFVIAWNIVHAVLAPIPALGWLFGLMLWLIWAVASVGVLVLWIITMVKAFSGVRWDIPYIGPMARKQIGEA